KSMEKKHRRKLFMFCMLLFSMVLFLGACASDDSSEKDENNGNKKENEDAENGRELADEQVLNLATNGIRTLDISKATEETSIGILSRIKSGLMIYDNNELIPDIAAGMPETNEDNTVYTYTIRDDAKWSDGTPITADDFV